MRLRSSTSSDEMRAGAIAYSVTLLEAHALARLHVGEPASTASRGTDR